MSYRLFRCAMSHVSDLQTDATKPSISKESTPSMSATKRPKRQMIINDILGSPVKFMESNRTVHHVLIRRCLDAAWLPGVMQDNMHANIQFPNGEVVEEASVIGIQI